MFCNARGCSCTRTQPLHCVWRPAGCVLTYQLQPGALPLCLRTHTQPAQGSWPELIMRHSLHNPCTSVYTVCDAQHNVHVPAPPLLEICNDRHFPPMRCTLPCLHTHTPGVVAGADHAALVARALAVQPRLGCIAAGHRAAALRAQPLHQRHHRTCPHLRPRAAGMGLIATPGRWQSWAQRRLQAAAIGSLVCITEALPLNIGVSCRCSVTTGALARVMRSSRAMLLSFDAVLALAGSTHSRACGNGCTHACCAARFTQQ
jgi:hypothetical protein